MLFSMNKRGIGHVEIIISFVMFSVFVITALYLFNPLDRSNISDASLTYAYKQIVENISTEVDMYTIVVNREAMGESQDYLVVKIKEIDEDKNVRAESYTGSVLQAKKSPSNEISIKIEENDIVILKFSEDFSPVNFECPQCSHTQEFYTIASSRSEKLISEKRAVELKMAYDDNYNLLKKQIGLSPREDFLFNLTFEDTSIGVHKDIPSRSDVLSTTVRKEVLKDNGKGIFGELTVKTW